MLLMTLCINYEVFFSLKYLRRIDEIFMLFVSKQTYLEQVLRSGSSAERTAMIRYDDRTE